MALCSRPMPAAGWRDAAQLGHGSSRKSAARPLSETGSVTGDSIRVVQGKTSARLLIPMHAKLREAIDATPKDNLTFLMTAFGRPFGAPGFGNVFREWCNKAGLRDLSAHGLRKAAARRLAEGGCTASQIAAVTGHKTLGEVTRYTAAADQARMARDAMDRMGS